MVGNQTPTIGQQTKEILSDILEYSDDQIQALVDKDVVAVN